MDSSNPSSSKYDIIGQVIYFINDETDDIDSTIQGLFSRVFIKYDQHQQELTHLNFKNQYLQGCPYLIEEERETLSDHAEEDLTIQEEFENYWTENGQDIILKLWFAKYKDFVDPAYNSCKDIQTIGDDNDNESGISNITESIVGTDRTKDIHDRTRKKITSTLNKTGDIGNYLDKIETETKSSESFDQDTCSSEKVCIQNNSINPLNDSPSGEELVNSEDYSQQWDQLWQDHCVEIYNQHFETFKQDWLKNLSVTLDIVNNTTGLEYFELAKQEVLAASQKHFQNKHYKQQLTSEEAKHRSDTKLRRNIETHSLGVFLENNLEKITKKYEELEDKGKVSERVVNLEINNKEEKIKNETGTIEENVDENFQELTLVSESKDNNNGVTHSKIRTKHIENFDDIVNCGEVITQEESSVNDTTLNNVSLNNLNGNFKDSGNSNKKKIKEVSNFFEGSDNQQKIFKKDEEEATEYDRHNEIWRKHDYSGEIDSNEEYTSEEEVDIDEVSSKESVLYNRFAEQPNYLLNKLGLQFGSTNFRENSTTSLKTPNTTVIENSGTIKNDIKDLKEYCNKELIKTETFFKHQKLNLFVSKSKFHKLNHRLKIDTKVMEDEIVDGFEERNEYNIHRDIKSEDDSIPLNKHTYFNYSDEDNEIIKNINVKEELEKKSENGDIAKNTDHFNVVRKNLEKKEKVVDTVKSFLFAIKSEKDGLGLNKIVETGKESNTDNTSDESPEEITIQKQIEENFSKTINSDDKQTGSRSPNIKLFNFTHETTNSSTTTTNFSSTSPVFVFQGQSSKDKTISAPKLSMNENSSAIVLCDTNSQTLQDSSFPNYALSDSKSSEDLNETCSYSNQVDGGYQNQWDEKDDYYNFKTEMNSQRKRNRRKKKRRDYHQETLVYDTDLGHDAPLEILANPYLNKYYLQRYLLWSRYDEGIRMDAESWYSVTPEKVAEHIASRVSPNDIVVDAFCGCGGNTIQFALVCQKVISIDIDPNKIRLAQHNASVYSVSHKIEFIQGDFFTLAPHLKADVVFLSPPWGGPEYRQSSFSINSMFPEAGGGKALFELAAKLSPNVAYYLPRNTDVFQLIPLAGPGSVCEVEQNFVGRKFVAMTAYYGNLVKRKVKRRRKRKKEGKQGMEAEK